jgi:hypothetical protein
MAGKLLAPKEYQKAMFRTDRGLWALTVSRLTKLWRNDGIHVTSAFQEAGLE